MRIFYNHLWETKMTHETEVTSTTTDDTLLFAHATGPIDRGGIEFVYNSDKLGVFVCSNYGESAQYNFLPKDKIKELKEFLQNLDLSDDKECKTENKTYVVNAYRDGNRENHSYTVCAFTEKSKAIDCADSHARRRGYKYVCTVEEIATDLYSEEDWEHGEVIYNSQYKLGINKC